LLGHASVQTSERYLGCKQRLSQAVNDKTRTGRHLTGLVTAHKPTSGPRRREPTVIAADRGQIYELAMYVRVSTHRWTGMRRQSSRVVQTHSPRVTLPHANDVRGRCCRSFIPYPCSIPIWLLESTGPNKLPHATMSPAFRRRSRTAACWIAACLNTMCSSATLSQVARRSATPANGSELVLRADSMLQELLARVGPHEAGRSPLLSQSMR
jgi:hypothetical protein